LKFYLEQEMNKLMLAMAVALLVSACNSPVKLDNVPVDDKAGSGVMAPIPDNSRVQNSAGAATVASVNVTQSVKDDASRIASRTVYFDFDSYAIRPEFEALIESHARLIKADKSKKVVLEGHTDERGGREYNLALGQKRAEAVKRSLGLLGVSESQLEAVSFGKEKPAVVGSTEAAMEKNRRTEISYR
jgi:peptidoglycan-associated lipoprotein